MNRRPAPLPVTRAGVALATAALRPADRKRYRAEFLAELHGLPPAAQLRYTAGVLVQTSPCVTRWAPGPTWPRRPR